MFYSVFDFIMLMLRFYLLQKELRKTHPELNTNGNVFWYPLLSCNKPLIRCFFENSVNKVDT